jgi:glycerol uptake facilitator-like aquaporin
MFASIKDGEWQRLGFIWIFICGPFIGAFTALIIVPTFYRYFFDKKAKYTI